MRPFIGTYENKVDQKGRVSVPAKFRAVLQAEGYASIVVRPDPERGCIEGYGMDRLERLSDLTPDIVDLDDPQAAPVYQILAESEELSFDPNGRVLIPVPLLEAAGLGETAVFVGLGRVFQIWNPQAYTAFRAQKLRPAASGPAKGATP
ncbi:division/cell wall cluster transcriptional repressor MraZ [Pararhodospirillum photometricum]|uniref:Transcriptional regulator MraZ n=1 Tax=Pararhodospirillum photometricum DSM 122 TaxID=1150469 RepID=H6SNG5_PARPM|nr:division/cell wall cluster transcriptional repressor MraZ [Pararhodospirillum photometricum]CCG09296.1 Protein mraZ [Pararhodospirillum photometricum DSM 122]